MRRMALSILSFLLCVSIVVTTSPSGYANRVEIEPNNSSSSAQWLRSGEALRAFFHKADDQDYFAIATHSAGDIRITVQSTDVDYIVALTDFHGKTLTSAQTTGDHTLHLANRAAGIYYISMKNNNEHRWGEYKLQVYFADNKQIEHTTELEPNDTRDNAYPIETAVTYHARFEHLQDHDYYQFQTEADGDIRLTIQSADTRAHVSLLDSRGKVLVSNSAGGDVSIVAERQPKGEYYVYVYIREQQYVGDAYSLQVLYPALYVRHDLTTLEPNDTKDYSYPVTSGLYYNATFEHRHDYDYYTFESEKSGDIYIHARSGNAKYQMYLLDERGKVIANTTAHGEKQLSVERQAAGRYYVYLVPHENVISDAYDLQVTYPVNRVEHNTSSLEPNNIKESAYYIQPGQLYHAEFESELDIDWYSMAVEPGPMVFSGTVDNGEYVNISIHDRFGKQLDRRSFNEVSDWTFDLKERGLYFIRLNTANRAKSYSFRVQYEQGVQIFINGDSFITNQPALVKGGGTLVPLRDIFEALGAEVDWNQEAQMITAKKGTHKITLQIGASTANKNGVTVPLSTPAQIVGTSTMVPLRFVSEALGAEVKWDNERRSVYIEN